MKTFLLALLLTASSALAIQDPCDFASPRSSAWYSIAGMIESRAPYGGLRLAVYEDGSHFVIVPRASVLGYAKGHNAGKVHEMIAPDPVRDAKIAQVDIASFAAANPTAFAVISADRNSGANRSLINIVVDANNLPIER